MTKLLIVDDEPSTVDMLQTFLQINGYEAVGALNGEDGFVLAQIEQPQGVILDLMLPDISGFEVCRRIRSLPNSAALPILILSATTDTQARHKAQEAGASSFMSKPVRFPELLAELARLLGV